MDITRKMQVDLLHREERGLATACSTTLDTKDWTHGGFAQRVNRLEPQLVQRHAQANGRDSLAFAKRCRRDSCHINILAIRFVLQAVEDVVIYLCHVLAKEIDFLVANAQRQRKIANVFLVSCFFEHGSHSSFMWYVLLLYPESNSGYNNKTYNIKEECDPCSKKKLTRKTLAILRCRWAFATRKSISLASTWQRSITTSSTACRTSRMASTSM